MGMKKKYSYGITPFDILALFFLFFFYLHVVIAFTACVELSFYCGNGDLVGVWRRGLTCVCVEP